MAKKLVGAGAFWVDTSDEKGNRKSEIILHQLVDFCSVKLGFFNYVDYSGSYILVRRSLGCIIEEVKIQDLKQAIKSYLLKVEKKPKVWAAFVLCSKVNENFTHLIDVIPSVDFNVSKKDEAYFFYRNIVVKVIPTGAEYIPYPSFHGTVWKSEILNRDFEPVVRAGEVSVFHQFLYNICGSNLLRYLSLKSILGYILHPYKDPSVSKAVILVDQNVDFSGEAHGGTGKSLVAEAIKKITSLLWKDGKRFNANNVFVFDDIRPFTRVIYFDDVKQNFPLEDFYAAITGNLRVERKYRDSVLIDAKNAPKLMISSNYMISGTGGDTEERRKIEFEIAPHYSRNHTPIDEFNHVFFRDWSPREWLLFDNLMLRMVSFYMKNGIIPPPQINLRENKLKQSTSPDFVVFADGTFERNISYDKANLLVDFIRICPAYRTLSAITFKKWLDKWASMRELTAEHTKSNGRALVIFSPKNSQ